MTTTPHAAMAPGSVSIRLYPHELPATAIVEELLEQGRLAAAAGFDGVMVAEHHTGAAPGYMPNPLQAAGWLLEAMPSGWAAANPLLLPLRPPALVVEEVAWLAARFPGRVGLGVGAGSVADDFEVMGADMGTMQERFTEGLAMVSAMLSGRDLGRLAGDAAVARCIEYPVPVVSAAMGPRAVRRAAASGVGLIIGQGTTERLRALVDLFHEAGGTGPVVLIRWAWVGPVPTDKFERQLDVYRSYATAATQAHWANDEMVKGDDPKVVAEDLRAVLAATGADALNLRVHMPGIPPAAVREQIQALGEVADAVRQGSAAASG